jgi:hypothetical protein
MVADAEKSRVEADAQWEDAEAARGKAEAARGEAEAARGEVEAARGEAEAARARAEAHRAHAMAVVSTMDFASFVPEIDIRELRGKCKEGHPVSTDINGFDGKNKSSIKIVMCGKGQAKVARMEAIKGLREARKHIVDDADIPDSVRKSVLESLEKQIEQMEKQLSNDDQPDSEV